MPVERVPTPFRAGFAIWGTFTEDPVFPLGTKKPRRSEAFKIVGGGKGVRTPGLRLAKPALSQLSYTPFRNKHPSGDSALAGVFIAKEDGGPDKIRTCDLPVISRTL